MRAWLRCKLFFQLITDREIYFLIGLAFGNLFRKTDADTTSLRRAKKRAKAMHAK